MNVELKSLDKITYEHIIDDFYYGMYGDFKVIINKDNDYINVSKISNTENKLFGGWNRNKKTKELIEELSKDTGINKNKLIIDFQRGRKYNHVAGTFIHPLLVTDYFSWISPKYSIKVAKIVQNYIVEEAIKKKDVIIKKKNDKIDELNDKVDELLNEAKEAKQRAISADKKLKQIMKQNEKTHEKLDRANDKKVVPTKNKGDVHQLIIVKNNSDNKIKPKYTAFRRQTKSIKTVLANHLKKYPNMEKVCSIIENPNAINLWLRVKTEINDKIKSKGNDFSLKSGFTEKELRRAVINVHNERFADEDNSESENEDSELEYESDSN